MTECMVLSAETCADLFFSYVVKHHGLPDVLVSDRGSQWLSQFWRALFKHCGTNLQFSPGQSVALRLLVRALPPLRYPRTMGC